MEITNLRDQDVVAIKDKIKELKLENPAIATRMFTMSEPAPECERVGPGAETRVKPEVILEKMQALEKKVNRLLIHFNLAKEDVLIV